MEPPHIGDEDFAGSKRLYVTPNSNKRSVVSGREEERATRERERGAGHA